MGLYRDMRYNTLQNLSYDYTNSIVVGFNYEFKFWRRLHFKAGINYTKVDLDIFAFEEQFGRYGNGVYTPYNSSVGDINVSGWHREFPTSLCYYIKPRIWKVEVGVAFLNQLNDNTLYYHTKTTFQNSPNSDPLAVPVVEENLRKRLLWLDSSNTIFIGAGYNYKLRRYQYISLQLRFGFIPHESFYSRFAGRFLSFSISYKYN